MTLLPEGTNLIPLFFFNLEEANIQILIGMLILLAIVISLGIYFSFDVEGESVRYIVAGRSLAIPLVGATLMAQSVDANMTLGNTDLAASFGFWAGAVLPIGLGLCLVVCGLFFAKPLNRLDLLTIVDYYGMKYGRLVELLAAVFTSFAFIVLLAGNMVAIAFLFDRFLGVSFVAGAIITGVIFIAYAIGGGLMSVSRVDIVQVTTVIIGIFALTVYVLITYGFTIPSGMGPGGFDQMYDPAQGAWINWATIFALALGDVVALDFMERVMAAETPEAARKGCLTGALGTFIVGIPFAIVALSMIPILDGMGIDPGEIAILYVFLENAVPLWIAALVLAGIFAASLSTGVGAIISTSAVFARNIFGFDVKGDEPPRTLPQTYKVDTEIFERRGIDPLLWTTRGAFLLITGLGIYIAVAIPATGALLVLAFDLMFATTFVPLLFGLYWPRFANKPAAMAAIAIGGGSRLVFFVLTPTLYGVQNTLYYIPNNILTAEWDGIVTLLAAVISFVSFVVVGALTQSTHKATYIDREPWPDGEVDVLSQDD